MTLVEWRVRSGTIFYAPSILNIDFMGKDREGVFHPKKGKPTNDSKEGLGVPSNITPESLKQDEQITDKYTKGEELAENVHVMHPNRNTQKKKSHQLTKQEDREQAQAGVNDDRNNMPQIGQPQAQELSYRMNKEELVSLIKKCTGYCVRFISPPMIRLRSEIV